MSNEPVAVPECPEDEHDWKIVHDWAGDPGVINGTYDINYKQCLLCGKEAALEDGDYGDYSDDYI